MKITLKDSLPTWITSLVNNELASFEKQTQKKFEEKKYDFLSQSCFWDLMIKYQVFKGKLKSFVPLKLRFNSRYLFMAKLIHQLHKHKPFPDGFFYLNLADGCNGFQIDAENHMPILSFAKRKKSSSILIPDFETLRDHKQILEEINEGKKIFPWKKKSNKGFFRGSTTGGHYTLANYTSFVRSKAVLFSLHNPQLLDARFTRFVQTTKDVEKKMRKEGFSGKFTTVKDHLAYKYLLLIDGNTACYSRPYWLLHSNSLMLKQGSEEIMWYFPLLQPYKHYIPIKSDLSDLKKQLFWALDHEEEVLKMIENANTFAKRNLDLTSMLSYLHEIIRSTCLLFPIK